MVQTAGRLKRKEALCGGGFKAEKPGGGDVGDGVGVDSEGADGDGPPW
jgi:hypothetical protein